MTVEGVLGQIGSGRGGSSGQIPFSPGAKKALDWNYGPFEIPDDVLKAWRKAGRRGKKGHRDWQARFDAKPEAQRAEFQRRGVDRKRPAGLDDVFRKLKEKLVADPPTVATRKASELVLDVLVPATSFFVTKDSSI